MTQSDVLIRYSEAKEALGGGCSDGYCCVEKPTGMHTNGGCKCASNPDFLRQQRMANIMRLAQEMSSEITRLRAALADAQAVGFAAGVEAAAKVAAMQAVHTREVIKRATASELVSNLVTVTKSRTAHDTEIAIRAITPPDATAAAARVLLPGMEQRHIDHMTSLDRDPEKYTSEYRMAAKALRAIAGDTTEGEVS